MFVLIVGAGKVGLNVARSLARLGHEFLVVPAPACLGVEEVLS